MIPVHGDLQITWMSMAGRIRGGVLQLESVYEIRYPDLRNISNLTCLPVPELLYYNRRGVFSDFMDD